MGTRLFEYYEDMERERVILYFNGPVSQSMVEEIATLMRTRMRAQDAGLASVQRVFAILVEQMQNIVRYSSDRHADGRASGGEMAHGQVAVGREEDGRFYVACGNRIRSTDSQELTRLLETLRSMGPEDLKAYYKEQRRNLRGTEKGAGLGFVEMARKSVSPLDFSITPLDGSTSFFSMKVVTQ